MVTRRSVAMAKEPDRTELDIIWGVEEIARYIKRSKRAAYYLIARGVIPVKKHGKRTISARKAQLDRALSQ
jgi:hypothetical protein